MSLRRLCRRNIAAFGGNPNNVTIFGFSAGGVSVHSMFADLINLDPQAEWDAATKTVINSCARSVACGPVSPRIVSILAFDPVWYERSWWHGGQPVLVATNILSVFIDGVVGGRVTGYVTTARWMNEPQPVMRLSEAHNRPHCFYPDESSDFASSVVESSDFASSVVMPKLENEFPWFIASVLAAAALSWYAWDYGYSPVPFFGVLLSARARTQ